MGDDEIVIDFGADWSPEMMDYNRDAARAAAMAEDCWLRGEVDAAIELELEAVEGYHKQGLPVERALLLRRLGLMYASKDADSDAERARGESLKVARELGMRPLIDVLGKERSNEGQEASVSGLTPGRVKRT